MLTGLFMKQNIMFLELENKMILLYVLYIAPPHCSQPTSHSPSNTPAQQCAQQTASRAGVLAP